VFPIRHEQLQVMMDDRMIRYLLDTLKANQRFCAGLDDATIVRRLRTGCAEARAYGLTVSPVIATFALLAVVVGPEFHHHPLVARILQRRDKSQSRSMLLLLDAMTSRDWQEAGWYQGG
jgi:hypothetical protein